MDPWDREAKGKGRWDRCHPETGHCGKRADSKEDVPRTWELRNALNGSPSIWPTQVFIRKLVVKYLWIREVSIVPWVLHASFWWETLSTPLPGWSHVPRSPPSPNPHLYPRPLCLALEFLCLQWLIWISIRMTPRQKTSQRLTTSFSIVLMGCPPPAPFSGGSMLGNDNSTNGSFRNLEATLNPFISFIPYTWPTFRSCWFHLQSCLCEDLTAFHLHS